MLPVPIVDDFEGWALLVNEDAYADPVPPDAGCQPHSQRKAANPVPPADPLNVRGCIQATSTTQGDCASFQRRCRRVIQQIHHDEVQGTSESKDHFPAVEAQHSWLQRCPRHDHLRLRCS